MEFQELPKRPYAIPCVSLQVTHGQVKRGSQLSAVELTVTRMALMRHWAVQLLLRKSAVDPFQGELGGKLAFQRLMSLLSPG